MTAAPAKRKVDSRPFMETHSFEVWRDGIAAPVARFSNGFAAMNTAFFRSLPGNVGGVEIPHWVKFPWGDTQRDIKIGDTDLEDRKL